MPLDDLLASALGTRAPAADAGAGTAEAPPAAAVAAEAAAQLEALLDAAPTIVPATAQRVTTFISSLLDSVTGDEPAGGRANAASSGAAAERGTLSRETSRRLQASVERLAAAAIPTDPSELANGTSALVLSSSQLNITSIATSDPEELTAQPVTCASAYEAPIAISLPNALLSGVSGFNASLPVVALLYTTEAQLHAPVIDGYGAAADRGGNDADVSSSARQPRPASPMVSFSLLQDGSALRVRGAADAINVSVPLSIATAGGGACVADASGALLARGCDATLECRWWDKRDGNGSWVTSGCTTIRGDGGVTCSCDHLTDFIVFELCAARQPPEAVPSRQPPEAVPRS